MEYEAAIEGVYGNGAFHMAFMFFTALINFNIGCEFQSVVFLDFVPKFTCLDVHPKSNFSEHSQLNNSSQINFFHLRKGPDQCFIGNTSVKCKNFHFDNSLMNRSLVTDYNLVCDRNYIAKLLTSASLISVALGHILAAFTDKLSRRKMIIFYTIWEMSCSLAIPFAPNLPLVFLFRILRGFSAPLAYYGSCLLQELLPTDKRTIYGNLYWISFSGGYMASAGLAYWTRDWYLYRLYGLVGLSGYLCLFLILPESPRWLCANGYYEDFRKFLAKIAKWNKVKISDDYLEEAVASAKNLVTKIPVNSASERDKNVPTNFFRVFYYPNMLKKLGIFCIRVPTVAICYYGLSVNANVASDDIFLNVFFMGLAELFACPFGLLVGRCLNRRMSSVFFNAFIIPCLLLGPIIRPYSTTANLLIFIIGKIMVTTAYNMTVIHMCEVFPTPVRAMGLFTTLAISCGFSGFAPFINGLDRRHFCLPGLLYSAMCFITGILVVLYLPDTKYCPMAQTLEQAESLYHGNEEEWIEMMLNPQSVEISIDSDSGLSKNSNDVINYL
ncbi:unnamed protein product [Rodentolepis nana]|uniref:MFS domain-containing protein n=1 Tax=Rodentolepis nana TaxID=102285 RepID=A0A0R3TSY5_RODNA|nr:unnamed protein product [Rodentolepis nana]